MSVKSKNPEAFTLIEVLLALAIMAMLLVAVAVALQASAVNYQENDDIFKTINKARQALFRITMQLRTAEAVDPNAPANECSLITHDSQDLTYRFSSADNKLYLIDNASATSYVLCDNVTAMTFTKNTAIEDSVLYVQSVLICITIQQGSMQKTVSAAAVVRRNLK